MRKFGMLFAAVAVVVVHGRMSAQKSGGAHPAGYEVTPAAGQWMILTTTYTGPTARGMAYKLLTELRDHYKLPAYIFSYGDEERRKEQERITQEKERIRKIIAQQQKFLEGTKGELGVIAPIRIRTRRFEDQYGVLVGGYPSFEAAHQEMLRIKKLKPPDPKRVPQPILRIAAPKEKKGTGTYLSPFAQAFVVRNPTVKTQAAAPAFQEQSVQVLKHLNSEEPYSLFKCGKRYTLVVALFRGATMIQSGQTTGNFLNKVGTGEPGAALDASARNAHNVAEFLHTKLNFEAYVLHTQYYSVVTVGGFDNLKDPQVKALKDRLSRMKLDPIPMLPQAYPMQVPQL
jgi:hypothetical protein